MTTRGASLFESGGSPSWLFSGDAETARGLLSSLLSGMMTMSSLVISVTFVILTLAANQLGPRLIGIFMADRQIQAGIGLFLGTITYTVVVLRSIDGNPGAEHVPHLAVSISSALTVLCLFTLLLYVHKIARSIIADTVVNRVADDLLRDVRTIASDACEEQDQRLPPSGSAVQALAIRHSGYIQTVDYAALATIASRESAVLAVKVRAGQFLLSEGEHILVHGPARLDDRVVQEIRSAFVVGAERTHTQDLEFAVRQLVEIALRALSPGINDPFTAVAVLNRLAANMETLFAGSFPARTFCGPEGTVRVIAERYDVDGVLSAGFDSIRQAGRGHPAILIRMADLLGALASHFGSDVRRAALQHLRKIAHTAERANLAPDDLQDVLARVRSSAT